MAAIKSGYQSVQLSRGTGEQAAVTLCMIAATALCLIGAGHLQEAEHLTLRAFHPQASSGSPRLPEAGWVMFCQAEILRAAESVGCCTLSGHRGPLPV